MDKPLSANWKAILAEEVEPDILEIVHALRHIKRKNWDAFCRKFQRHELSKLPNMTSPEAVAETLAIAKAIPKIQSFIGEIMD